MTMYIDEIVMQMELVMAQWTNQCTCYVSAVVFVSVNMT